MPEGLQPSFKVTWVQKKKEENCVLVYRVWEIAAKKSCDCVVNMDFEHFLVFFLCFNDVNALVWDCL